jgi:hypothetical protein
LPNENAPNFGYDHDTGHLTRPWLWFSAARAKSTAIRLCVYLVYFPIVVEASHAVGTTLQLAAVGFESFS